MKLARILMGLAAVWLLSCLEGSLALADSSEEFRAYLEDANDRYEEAFRNGDAAAIAGSERQQ